MITVFKTNVKNHVEAKKLVRYLLQEFPGGRVNVDLKDCDKVLRVEADDCVESKVVRLVEKTGFACAPLP